MSDRDAQHVYILHTRKYRDTSLIADVFSREEGRYSLVIRGARSKKSHQLSLLQPFSPILVTPYGRGEMRTAGALDFTGRAWRLTGESLFIGMYVNELLYRLLGKFDPLPVLFAHYEGILADLESDRFQLRLLREFELSLLANLGYGITFDYDVRTGESIHPDKQYRFVAEEGFHSLPERGQQTYSIMSYKGRELLAIAGGNSSDSASDILKQVVRQSIEPLLGGKPLKSRSLFEGRVQ
jgi:DNA repair protein RecO (recombination protein O)